MNAALKLTPIAVERADLAASIFAVTGRDSISIRAGSIVIIGASPHAFEQDTPVDCGSLVPGQDYGIRIDAIGRLGAIPIGLDALADGVIFGGFHFAPSGNAAARSGGDGVAAINPLSCWDVGFRPACPDPRGMALVDGRFWADIYLLNVDHLRNGTSHCGATIADGRDLPQAIGGQRKVKKLDYATAVEIYAHHGKQMLGAEEFFAAAYGVTERASRDDEPATTGDLAGDSKRFVSKSGLHDATGTMWQWGTDGDPDNPRASIFGGSWISGSVAGSRCAYLGCWPGSSNGSFSARGRSDHLKPAA